MSVPRLPPGIPPGLAAQLAERMVGPGAPGGMPPMPQQAPAPPGGAPTLPAPPPQPMPAGPPPDGPQQPPPTGPEPPPGVTQPKGVNDDGKLTPEIAETLRELMRKRKSRQEILSIVHQVSGDERAESSLKIDPGLRLRLAQGWNARISEQGKLLTSARGDSPGASKASDEAILRIYWTTPLDPNVPEDDPAWPKFIELDDIDDYADAVRAHLVLNEGMTDEDEIEDQVVRECFPLRELQIKAGRKNDYRGQVDFVNEVLKLTGRWFEKFGELPKPDTSVLKATKAGKGDPESQALDTDSSAFPPGNQDPFGRKSKV